DKVELREAVDTCKRYIILLNARHDSGDSNLSVKQPPSMHYLLHVPDFIDVIGPLRASSYRAVKITNDFYARQIKVHNQMGAELANIHIKFAGLHAMSRMTLKRDDVRFTVAPPGWDLKTGKAPMPGRFPPAPEMTSSKGIVSMY
ncbi:hypothetical protein GGF37_001949, partial [Kickxella alabastrina]